MAGIRTETRRERALRHIAFIVTSSAFVSGCAMPSADQGQGQGSSSTPTFVFAPVLNFGAVTGGSKGADSSSTTAPTSAPAATSANEATQKADAKADVTATVPAGGVPALNGVVPAPTPKPGE